VLRSGRGQRLPRCRRFRRGRGAPRVPPDELDAQEFGADAATLSRDGPNAHAAWSSRQALAPVTPALVEELCESGDVTGLLAASPLDPGQSPVAYEVNGRSSGAGRSRRASFTCGFHGSASGAAPNERATCSGGASP